MKAITLITLTALAVAAFGTYKLSTFAKAPETFGQSQARIAKEINAMNTSWKAETSARFINESKESMLKHMMPMETHIENQRMFDANTHGFETYFAPSAETVPASFDSQTNWPACKSIDTIRDQSSCGSCWAFGTAEAMTDRLCIDGQTENPILAAEDINECCNILHGCFSQGCNGGQPSGAWKFGKKHGVVTGGLYNDNSTCKPYKFAPCAHHVTSEKYPDCPSDEYSTPSCASSCYGDTSRDYTGDKYMASDVKNISGEANMKSALQQGPLTCAFTVYDDFPTYKSGVYVANSSSQLGGHAIKVVGYGTENGVDYWRVANSWNETWGDAGFFKIKRGSDECGIEDQCVAGNMTAKN